MSKLIVLLQHYGVLIVFLTVLVEQIGMPIPAYPVLIVAGALAMNGDVNWTLALLVALAACLISDFFWFNAGRHYGRRILRVLCRISLNPDYCVSQTEDNFSRHGAKSLIVAKFIPGFNTVGPPLAGAMGVPVPRFFGFALAGGLLWSGTGLAIGAYFHASIDQVLDIMSTMGTTALMVLGALLLIFVLMKYLERREFQRRMQSERIDVDELLNLIEAGHQPQIVDARSMTAQQMEAAIPGALIYHATTPDDFITQLDKERHIVVYCSCPNDVTAIAVAKQLNAQGFAQARPLAGGLDAWNARRGQAASVSAA